MSTANAQATASGKEKSAPQADLANQGERQPKLNVELIHDQLLGKWREERLTARALAADPDFQPIPGQNLADYRERVLGQLQLLVDRNQVLRAFPTHLGGEDNPGGNIAGFEEFILADPSLQIKAGVQWGLFGAAVLHLGTQEHHDRLLEPIMKLQVPGCFAMTETGHGSDVSAIGTTATYDPQTEEFIIHTPIRAAWKEYIGNAAVHGVAAVVFAQLITRGVNHGVHAFYVPLREKPGGAFLPGIGGEDDGHKGGLLGVDNGRLHFDQVRIPRRDLLDRYGQVAADGTYSSPISSPGRRFFTMLSTLVQGRVSLSGAAVVAQKAALAIAVTYANQRRQFAGGNPVEETVLLDYREHQRRLIPLIADAYAQQFAHHEVAELFHDVFSGARDTDADREDLETIAATLKPTTTWGALRTIQACREACGGAGYMAENRLTGLHADLDVYATFEGDNTVLLQLVAKRLIGDYAKELGNIDAGGVAKLVVDRAADLALHRTPLRRVGQALADAGSARRSAAQLQDPQEQHDLLRDRFETMLEEVAAALRPALKLPREQAAALANEHQHDLIEMARAYSDLVVWESFRAAVDQVSDADSRQIMTWLRDVHGLVQIERNLAWYLINGRLSGQRARTVSSYVDRLIARLRPHAQELVDAFGYSPESLRAPIASGIEAERQAEASAYYSKLRASGQAPVSEKSLS